MLTISESQFRALEGASLDDYAPRLASELAADDPTLAARTDLLEVVHRAVLRAWSLKLRQDRELRAFAELALYIGERFHAYPDFEEILSLDPPDGSSKLSQLYTIATTDQWLAAADFCSTPHRPTES